MYLGTRTLNTDEREHRLLRYWVDENPNPKDKALVDQVVADLKDVLIPEIPFFQDFEVVLVKSLRRYLGRYIANTNDKPIVILSLGVCRRACKEYGSDMETAIRTTIVHELGHAIQEAANLPQDEDEAEGFAFEDHHGNVMKFWEDR